MTRQSRNRVVGTSQRLACRPCCRRPAIDRNRGPSARLGRPRHRVRCCCRPPMITNECHGGSAGEMPGLPADADADAMQMQMRMRMRMRMRMGRLMFDNLGATGFDRVS